MQSVNNDPDPEEANGSPVTSASSKYLAVGSAGNTKYDSVVSAMCVSISFVVVYISVLSVE